VANVTIEQLIFVGFNGYAAALDRGHRRNRLVQQPMHRGYVTMLLDDEPADRLDERLHVLPRPADRQDFVAQSDGRLRLWRRLAGFRFRIKQSKWSSRRLRKRTPTRLLPATTRRLEKTSFSNVKITLNSTIFLPFDGGGQVAKFATQLRPQPEMLENSEKQTFFWENCEFSRFLTILGLLFFANRL